MRTVPAWLSAHRRAHDALPRQCAAAPWVQTVLLERWLADATAIAVLAHDARVSSATA